MVLVSWFGDSESANNVKLVGGKNASLSNLYRMMEIRSDTNLRVPNGFALTTDAYHQFVDDKVKDELRATLGKLQDHEGFPLSNLHEISAECREIVYHASRPGIKKNNIVWDAIISAYHDLSSEYQCFPPDRLAVAVRSSASAEDLPHASFAGQMESYLNVRGDIALIESCRHCMASVYTSRAIAYRKENKFDDFAVRLSVGVMPMIRADVGASGVLFTCQTETGHDGFVEIESVFGLGESLVLGKTVPDTYLVHKQTFIQGFREVLSKKLGSKQSMMIYAAARDASGLEEEKISPDGGEQDYHYFYRDRGRYRSDDVAFTPMRTEHAIESYSTPKDKQRSWTLSEEEVLLLVDDALEIERIYGRIMDIEFAKDGISGQVFILQARPETVSAARREQIKSGVFVHYEIDTMAAARAIVLCTGTAIGDKIASGTVRIVSDAGDRCALDACVEGDILVCKMTNPDLVPVMNKASAVITEKGGRTSHASIVCREMGLPCIVGAVDAFRALSEGQVITVSCCEGEEGKVYAGDVPFHPNSVGNLSELRCALPSPDFVRINIGEPSRAIAVASTYPDTPVGLVRMEFVVSQEIGIHPMALVVLSNSNEGLARCTCRAHSSCEKHREMASRLTVCEAAFIHQISANHTSPADWFVDTLVQNLGTIAAAFYPQSVIIRSSDFKTNEYEELIGAAPFEKHEENPLLGFRGAARYTDPRYEEAFRLEVRAIHYLRTKLGLTNVELLIPFVRSPSEGGRVMDILRDEGALGVGVHDLKVNLMLELPTNALLLDEYLRHFDGVSIGTNDLSMLVCGVDRDSADLSHVYGGAVDDATLRLITLALDKGLKQGVSIGLCGEAGTDPQLLRRLLGHGGLGYVSVNASSLIPVTKSIGEILDQDPSIRQRREPATAEDDDDHTSSTVSEGIPMRRSILSMPT